MCAHAMCFKLTRLAAADQPATLAAAGAAADGARRRLDRRGRSRALEQRVFVEGVLYIHHVAQPSVVIAVQFCIHLIDLVGREDRDLRTDVVLGAQVDHLLRVDDAANAGRSHLAGTAKHPVSDHGPGQAFVETENDLLASWGKELLVLDVVVVERDSV